jgi:hypothetical protein
VHVGLVRRLLVACLALIVSGCWTGLNLYSASDARTAIPPGVYRSSGTDEPSRIYRVSILSDGLTQFDTGEKKEVYGFAPLDPAKRTFVAWMEVDDGSSADREPADENQIYALAERRADGSFMIYLPQCDGDQMELARASGAIIRATVAPTCRFTDRSSLEAALRRLPRDDKEALKLVRVP